MICAPNVCESKTYSMLMFTWVRHFFTREYPTNMMYSM